VSITVDCSVQSVIGDISVAERAFSHWLLAAGESFFI